MKIYLDMDGTIVDLYGQRDWLEKITSEKKGLFLKAKPLVNIASLQRVVKKENLSIEIITWLPLNCSEKYGEQVAKEKREWVKKHFKENVKMHILPYGTDKSTVPLFKEKAILFDDNEQVRNQWKGIAFDEKSMFSTISKLRTDMRG